MTTNSLPQVEDLTITLRNSGALADARVIEVSVESDRPTLVSRIVRLRLGYDRAAPDAPTTVILKTGLAHTMTAEWEGGKQEVEFYTRIAPVLPDGVVPRCYEARWDADTHGWHLLLEDLADTHIIATTWPLPPTQQQCATMMTARARFHAAWWDDPRLGVSVGEWRDAEGRDARLQRLQELRQYYSEFRDRLGDNLPMDRCDLFERYLDAIPRLATRYKSHRNMTVVQGDAHVWNCFLPRDGGNDVRLFDWDLWRPHIAALDLAYMMAMHWYPDRRQRMEAPLLDHYHAALVEQGVTGYDRAALDDDYRWSVLSLIAVPVWQAAKQIPPVVWWNNLERILLAVDDLGCHELLG